ncbi:MAG: hypothetical protein LBB21_04980 [Holosporaceae bacterium]|jgi:tRNA nucleotidyltransferase/poly(A) polymerase|nr:hypothetical protein [Holosporaceae bacterium]
MGHLKNSLIDGAFFLLDLLEKNGHKARIVGGAVRDFLLKKDFSDIDIATTATPPEIIDICSNNELIVIPLGELYGSMAVIHKHKVYEITTLRKDVKTFGRHAEVIFSKSFEEDSNRRDFTINAIYIDKKGKIYDYHSSIEDLHSKNVRFIGDPKKRIEEDYLRIFRYFRFVAGYGNFNCKQEYINIINELKTNVKKLSSERVICEMLKIFEIQCSNKIISQMRPILDVLFSLECNSIDICEKWKILDTLSCEEKLSMLLKFSNKDDLISKYNFSKKIRNMILLKVVDQSNLFAQLKKIRKEYRTFYAKFWVVHAYVHNMSSEIDILHFMQKILKFCESECANFKLNVNDLTEYNLTQDELKNVMVSTKKYWLDNDDASYEKCKKFAKNIVCKK